VRKALATLPWVEQSKIQTDVPTREVRFNLTDKTKWNEEEVRQAFKDNGFKDLTVTSAPK
jgi:hypothetical protein